MTEPISLRLSLFPNSEVLVPHASETGLTTGKSEFREPQEENVSIMLKTSETALEESIRKHKEEELLVTPELVQRIRKEISKAKQFLSVRTAQQQTSSKTLGQDSTTTERASSSSSERWKPEISEQLWLPTETDCVDTELNWSIGSSENIIRNSWFSVKKLVPLTESESSLPIYSTFVAPSSQHEIEEDLSEPAKPLYRIKTVRLSLSRAQKRRYKTAMDVCRYIYNKCVEIYRANPSVTPKLTDLRRMFITSETANIPENMREATESVPYDIKGEVIRDFLKALKILKARRKENPNFQFTMKFRNRRETQSIVINHVHINGDTCYSRFYGRGALKCSEGLPVIKSDCRLTWDKFHYYLDIPLPVERENRETVGKVCALDPGEKIFQTVYGSDKVSYLVGTNERIDRLSLRASNYRNGLYEDGRPVTKRKTRQKLKRVAKRLENKAKHLITDIHRKMVKFLTTKYDTIIIPKFQTTQMVKKGPTRKINKGTSRRLIRWSHYQFRQLLIAKGAVRGNHVFVGTEEWTTKTCGRCRTVNNNVGGSRVFSCNNCGATIHRDVNGARNILLLNWDRASLTTD